MLNYRGLFKYLFWLSCSYGKLLIEACKPTICETLAVGTSILRQKASN